MTHIPIDTTAVALAEGDSLLAIVTTPDITRDEATRRISTRPFDALIQARAIDAIGAP